MWHTFLMRAATHYLKGRVQRRPPRPFRDFSPAQVRRVLLLNATALGDWLFSTPAIRALKETYPAWQLDALVHPRCRELAAGNPRLSRLWLYPGRGFHLPVLMRRLRGQGYDLAVILHGNDPEATLIAQATGAPFLVGSGGSPLAFAYSAGISPADPLQHAIERRLAYARLLGADTGDRRMEVFLPDSEKERALDLLTRHFGRRPTLLAALHATGSAPYKWWPLERYAALGRYLVERHKASLLLISGTRDRAVAETLAAALPGPALVTGGRFNLLTVAGLLSHCRLLVANDSGPLHLALALGVPSLALLGADHPARIGPYGVEWGASLYKAEEVCPEPRCLNRRCPDNRCLQAVSVEEVIATLETWWEPRFREKT